MKTKKASDLFVTILITVLVVVLAGLLIAWATGMFKEKKNDINKGTEKIDKALGSIEDFDLLVYDNDNIDGDALLKLISEFDSKEVPVSIWVHTLDNTDAYYNYAYTANNLGAASTAIPPESKSATGYITPSGNFKGELLRNANDEIVCLKFTQQK